MKRTISAILALASCVFAEDMVIPVEGEPNSYTVYIDNRNNPRVVVLPRRSKLLWIFKAQCSKHPIVIQSCSGNIDLCSSNFVLKSAGSNTIPALKLIQYKNMNWYILSHHN